MFSKSPKNPTPSEKRAVSPSFLEGMEGRRELGLGNWDRLKEANRAITALEECSPKPTACMQRSDLSKQLADPNLYGSSS